MNLIIPVGLLCTLNCLIYRALNRNPTVVAGRELRRNVRGGGGSNAGNEIAEARGVRLTRTAIVIVCVFLVCHVPRFIPNVIELFTKLPKVNIMRRYY